MPPDLLPGTGVRAVDARFVLPHPVRTAAVIGGLEAWDTGLRMAGIDVSDEPRPGTDLVVAPAGRAAAAVTHDARSLILFGRADRAVLEAAGYRCRRVLALAGREGPRLLVPVDAPRAFTARLAPAAWTPWKLEAAAAAAALRVGAFPRRNLLTIATRDGDVPHLLSMALGREGAARTQWLLQLGHGDVLQRATMPVIPFGASEPASIVKFARVPEAACVFSREATALAAAHAAGPGTSEHAPRLLFSGVIDGLPASVESAAPGRPLVDLLRSPLSRRRRLALVDRVARWILTMAVESGQGPRALAPERGRLGTMAADRLRGTSTREAMAAAFDAVPAVLVHNDLGTWNVVTDGDRFMAVDWESCIVAGLPLWDLLYFLADALLQLDGPREPAGQVRWLVRLFRGETEASAVLFDWTRQAVDRLCLPASAVGPIAALCWVHHASSPGLRTARLAVHDEAGTTADVAPLARLADAWLADPSLRFRWTAWRR